MREFIIKIPEQVKVIKAVDIHEAKDIFIKEIIEGEFDLKINVTTGLAEDFRRSEHLQKLNQRME
jgi:hypothetical protein